MRPTTVILAVLALVLSGCGDSDDQLDMSGPIDTGVTLDKSEPWDLVWFSDSMGEWVAEDWADLIEEAEGVEVRVHDHWTGGASIEQARQWLDVENIRQEVAEAEIIVVYHNPSSNTAPPDTYVCAATPSSDPDPPEFYTSADFAPYGDVLREILGVVFELRAGQPTVIRVLDQVAGGLADWREAGIEEECTATWEALSGAIREVGDEYGVATASVYGVFNGPDHDKDPREEGYMAGDGYHFSREGALAKAEFLHSLGYGAIIP
jgi:hypothetical protein